MEIVIRRGGIILALTIEIIVLCLIFTLVFVGTTLKDPLSMVHDFPPEIIGKVKELGLLKESQDRKSKKIIIKRIFAIIIFGFIFALVVYNFNNVDNFIKGFLYTYLICFIVNTYDTIVIDLIWFRNSKKARIPGTEDMKEYKSVLFHIKAWLKGILLGVPACIISGVFIEIFNFIIK